MSRRGLLLVAQVLLGLFVCINVFLYVSAKWTPERMPGIAGWRVLSVLTGSMEPVIRAGDMVIVAKYQVDHPQVGDVITFWQDEARSSLITHRVMERLDENGYVLTKGDANQETDGGWTAPDRILGKVVVTIPYAAALQNFLRHPVVLGLMILLLLATSYRQWKQRNRGSGETLGRNKEDMIHEQSV